MDIALRVLAIVVWPAVVLVIAVVAMAMFRRSIAGLLQQTKTLELWKLKIETLQRYVGPVTLAELEKNPQQLQPEGARRRVTVLHAQLQGFTTLAETLAPEAVAALSQEYLSATTEIVFELAGTLDRYAGYELTAYWGAPVATGDASDRACAAALRIRDRVEELRTDWQERFGASPDVRTVLTTGDMVVGNLGPRDRFQYGIVGEALDVLPRLLSAVNEFRVKIGMTQFTRDDIGDRFELIDVGQVMIKGKAAPVRIYELAGPAGQARPASGR